MSRQRNEPDLQDIINGAMEDLNYSFNCHRIGIIENFNPINQLATVRMVDKGIIQYDDGEKIVDYSLLVDCPIFIHKGINGGITIPILKGDSCLICFNDRSMDRWLEDGQIQRPIPLRAHDLSDAIAIVGIRNKINKLTDFNNDATEINYLDNKIIIANSKISLLNSSGGSLNIDDKLELKNTSENLKDLIDELITIITNLKVIDPISGNLPIDGNTSSSLSSLSTRLGNLLK